jgi:hypothetical protein
VAIADGYRAPEVSAPALLEGSEKLVRAYAERTRRSLDHVRDFLDCIRSRRETIANPVVMHRSMSTVHAANICMWMRRDLRYDPAKEQFLADADANRLLSRPLRKPWTLPT